MRPSSLPRPPRRLALALAATLGLTSAGIAGAEPAPVDDPIASQDACDPPPDGSASEASAGDDPGADDLEADIDEADADEDHADDPDQDGSVEEDDADGPDPEDPDQHGSIDEDAGMLGSDEGLDDPDVEGAGPASDEDPRCAGPGMAPDEPAEVIDPGPDDPGPDDHGSDDPVSDDPVSDDHGSDDPSEVVDPGPPVPTEPDDVPPAPAAPVLPVPAEDAVIDDQPGPVSDEPAPADDQPGSVSDEPAPADDQPGPPDDGRPSPGPTPAPGADRLEPAEVGTGATRVEPDRGGIDPLEPSPDGLPEVVEEPPAPLPETETRWQGGAPRVDSPRGPGPSPLQPGRTPSVDRVRFVDDIDVILATIRQLESGERYHIGPNRAGASGAYQFIPSTWNGEAGYPEAYLAPPEVQDARARADVERFLAMYGGDVSMIPIMWYYPRAAADPSWMDRVPNPAGGNVLTIREYQQRWLDLLVRNAESMLGAMVTASGGPAAASVLSDLPEPAVDEVGEGDEHGAAGEADLPGDPDDAGDVDTPGDPADPDTVPPIELDALYVDETTLELAARSVPLRPPDEHGLGSMRSIVFPVLGPATYADGWGDPRDGGARRHEGTDIIGVKMQPLLAAVDGVISHLRVEPTGISGVALSIQDADGWRYNYFHINNDTPATDDGAAEIGFRLAPGLAIGDEVVAGQIIGYMGDSGNAEASVPHLHFELRDPEGRARPSYWSLRAAEARQACTVAIGPWATPHAGVETGDDELAGDDLVGDELAGDERRGDDQVDVADEPDDVWHTVVTPLFGEGEWIIDSEGRVTATGDAALIVPSRDLECDPGPSAPFGTDSGGWGEVRPGALEGTVWADVDLAGTPLDGVVPPAPDEPDEVDASDEADEVDAADEVDEVSAGVGDEGDHAAGATEEPSPVDDGAVDNDARVVQGVAGRPQDVEGRVGVGPGEGSDDDDLPIDDDRRPLVFIDPASGERIIVVFDPLPVDPLMSAAVYGLPPGVA